MKFVQENYESEYVFSFKLEKTGVQYQTEMATIWLEDIVDLGVSAEQKSNLSIQKSLIKLFSN